MHFTRNTAVFRDASGIDMSLSIYQYTRRNALKDFNLHHRNCSYEIFPYASKGVSYRFSARFSAMPKLIFARCRFVGSVTGTAQRLINKMSDSNAGV